MKELPQKKKVAKEQQRIFSLFYTGSATSPLNAFIELTVQDNHPNRGTPPLDRSVLHGWFLKLIFTYLIKLGTSSSCLSSESGVFFIDALAKMYAAKFSVVYRVEHCRLCPGAGPNNSTID